MMVKANIERPPQDQRPQCVNWFCNLRHYCRAIVHGFISLDVSLPISVCAVQAQLTELSTRHETTLGTAPVAAAATPR